MSTVNIEQTVRGYVDGPGEMEVETQFGTMTIRAMDYKRVYVYADRSRPITVNRVRMYANVHFVVGDDGFGLDSNEYTVGANRLDWHKEVSYAAKKKIATVLVGVVQKWAAEHPGLLIEAGKAAQNNRLHSLEGQALLLVEQLTAKRDEIAKVESNGEVAA